MDETLSQYLQVGRRHVGDVFAYAHELSERLSEENKARIARRSRLLRQDTLEWLAINSLGTDPAFCSLHRYIQSEIYVDTTDDQGSENYEIAKAFSRLLAAAGFEAFDDSQPEFGSMRWRRVHRTKHRKTVSQLNDRLTLLQLALTTSFKKAGIEVEEEAEDRAEMERVHAQHTAELRKMEAETEQAKAEAKKAEAETKNIEADTELKKAETKKTEAETGQAKAEALKALAEAADTFVKVLRKAAVTFAIAIGTLHMWGNPVHPPSPDQRPTIEFKVNSHKFSSSDAREISGSVWVHLPQQQKSESAEVEEGESHDPLDSE